MNTSKTIDELGKLHDYLSILQAQYDKHLKLLKERLGIGTYEGQVYQLKIFSSSRSSVDWESLYESHPRLRSIIEEYTISKPFNSASFTLRKDLDL